MRQLAILMSISIFLLSACKKKDPAPVNNTPPPDYMTISFTIIDNQTQLPIEGAYVQIYFGNGYGAADGLTNVDGKVDLNIKTGMVLNTVKVTKYGYCRYEKNPNSTNYSYDQTHYLDHYAYLRIHVLNEAPAATTDGLEIYVGHPTDITGYSFSFNGIVDQTFITDCFAGNLSLPCMLYDNGNYVSTFYKNVATIGGDTVDLLVNY